MDPASACLNCGDATPGRYCPSCGQEKTDVQVSIRAMLTDALEDELTVDRRLPATLGALFLDPGQLTAEYVNGRIVRYVRPFRLYLVSSVLFFLLLSFTSLRFVRQADTVAFTPRTAAVDTLSLQRIDVSLDSLRMRLEAPDVTPAEQDALRFARSLILQRRATIVEQLEPDGATAPSDPPDAMTDEPAPDLAQLLGDASVNLGHPALNAAANAKIRSLSRMEPRQAIERLASDFLRYIPTVLFVLLPVFAGFLKLLYLRSRRYYAEHVVFLLHTHAFVFLLFTLLLLMVLLGLFRWWVIPPLTLWLMAYTYLAMLRVYRQGALKTLVKWGVLTWTYAWILGLAVPAVLVATALLA
jgi:hypothetical protein